MPSQQHEQWKQDLFDHLDRKLSGCVSCEAHDASIETHVVEAVPVRVYEATRA